MPRQRLPNRRRAVLVTADHRDSAYEVGLGFYDDGTPGELFISGARTGSDIDALVADATVIVSRALQHGDDLADLAKAMGREGDGATPSSAIGAVLDRLVAPETFGNQGE